MKKILILVIFLTILLLVNNHLVFADTVSCHCYCGTSIPAPCGDEDCKRACGYHEPSTGSTSGINPGSYSGITQPFYNLGYGIGQSIGQALMGNPQQRRNEALNLNNQGIQYVNNQQWQQAADAFAAALAKSPGDQTIRQNLELAQQVLAQQKQEAEARKKQETYDHLASKLKPSDDAKSGSLGLNDLKQEDSDSGHVGIKGLPGLALNDNTGNGSNTPYGISGLPGVYVNGPGSGSGIGQPGEGKLQLMKDDDSTTQPQIAIAPAPASLQQQAGASQAAAAASSPEDASAKARAGFDSALPQPQITNAPAPASLQQQAGASQAAAAASSPEKASTQARGGFDSALPSASIPSSSGAVDLRGTHTTVVNPAIVNGSSPALATTTSSDADKALMKLQWEMSIDPRYLNDPAVQQNIRDLWVALRSRDYTANNKLKTILADQFKADGQTPQQIADFFMKFDSIATGEGSTPEEWREVSDLANAMDAGLGSFVPPVVPSFDLTVPKYYSQKVTNIGPAESIKATDISYMGFGKQTKDDCVLYAIADGSGVKLEKVKDEFKIIVKNLGMDSVEERTNPEIAVTSPKEGGRGGASSFEELLVAEKFGKVIPVPNDSYARAIASTGRPVITTVDLNPPHGLQHAVVVTGVYRAKDGKIYYSVMDSNLGSDYNKSTDYVEKSFFEDHLASGGFIVMPKNN